MAGRPSDYSDDLAAAICLRLAEGESLRQICRDEAMPDKATALRWLLKAEHAAFRDQYSRAREAQADTLADEIIEIADETSGDYKTLETDQGDVEVVDHEHIQRSRLRVDARKWAAAKMAPKKYGDRVAHEHAGPDGGPIPLEHKISPEQVADELADIFAGAGAAAAIPAAAAAPVAVDPAGQAPRSDPVVHEGPDEGGGGEPGALPPGAPVVIEERSFFSADGGLPEEGP